VNAKYEQLMNANSGSLTISWDRFGIVSKRSDTPVQVLPLTHSARIYLLKEDTVGKKLKIDSRN